MKAKKPEPPIKTFMFVNDGNIIQLKRRPASHVSKQAAANNSELYEYVFVPVRFSKITGKQMPPSKLLGTTVEITPEHIDYLISFNYLTLLPNENFNANPVLSADCSTALLGTSVDN